LSLFMVFVPLFFYTECFLLFTTLRRVRVQDLR
jgi:hypothetical protein